MQITYERQWDKRQRGINRGWNYRSSRPQSIIVHTTNGRIGTSFESEVSYIVKSNDIGAHFVVSKDGKVVQTLDPIFAAWHAGDVINPVYGNDRSIGIEVHYTPGEGLWTNAMYQSLGDLIRLLTKKFAITDKRLVETHRAVAVFKNGKLGRKIDPSGFGDRQFYQWRDELFDLPTERTTPVRYTVLYNNVLMRSGPTRSTPEIARFNKGAVIYSPEFVYDTMFIDGINTWAKTTHNGKTGYVHTSVLRLVQ